MMDYYSAIKKQLDLGLCNKWMDFVYIVLREIGQAEKTDTLFQV